MSRLRFDCRLDYGESFRLDAPFEAGDGVTGLFGPSGSGKSTIFGLIAGILRPSAGSIHLGEQTLVDTARGWWLPPEQRHVGVVFQDHLLFPHLTVRQNLLFGKRRRPRRDIDLGRVVDILELGELLDRAPQTLSGGQKQRVSLGRALLRGPELLLMDEPLTALDQGLKDRVLTYLERAIAEWHLATLFVSHDPADVRRLADRVVVLEHGRVVGVGPTAAILGNAPGFRQEIRPSPLNLLQIIHVQKVGECWEGRIGEQRLPLSDAAEGRGAGSVRIQIAPQDVKLTREPGNDSGPRISLRGQVRQLIPISGRFFIAVDVGQFLWAEVPADEMQRLRLQQGEEIVCVIDPSALQFLA